ncbi:hypothetical protein B0H65DRAFT_511219 [Neurospora tetraspora]|uniref:Nephrocystin 3-like N-terminal domain-containing protein n=1 Tax=Neurospora tetraspora TaxID=94610 RepID=A0AAE0J8A8_9PEZI|nr:hypothetical protein B0H65DRAFT_511219 [Neurospora tetraspora]
MTTDDFKNDSDSDSTQTPNQRFAAVRRDQTAPENSSESKHQEAQLRAFINDFSRDVAAKKKNSKSARALDKLGPFVLSLTELAKFCETVFGACPMAVAAIFSGARMVLMLALNAQECLNTVIEALDEIDTYLHCYDNFYDAYRDDPVMQARLVASYRNILQFWWESIKILSNSSIAKGLISPLDKDIKDCLRTIKEDRTSVQYMLRDQIIPWVAGPEGPSKLDPRHRKKSDPVLWYNAPPGCGKTILASQIVSRLKQENHKVVWYFCSFDDPTRKDPRNALRSIAIQLLCRYMSKRIPDKVVDMFREDQANSNNFINHERPLMDVVHELLKATSLAYIVVDGLDEIIGLDQERPYPFHGMFEQLISQASERHGTTKWCFTSRNEGPIGETMSRVKAFQIVPSSASLAADIKAYLEDMLSEKELSPDQIEDLVEASEGNFLYAKLRADTLLGQGITCEEEAEEELRTYPKGLSGCYLRSLEKLNYRTTYEQELASPDGLPESFETDPEHAFLRYASVFWFQHLDMRGVACEEMRQEIRKFIQSCGFWTAFRVQTKVARYLFAQYVQRGSCELMGRNGVHQTSSLQQYRFGGISLVMGGCQRTIWRFFTIFNASSWSGTRHSRLAWMLCCCAPWTLQQSSWTRQSGESPLVHVRWDQAAISFGSLSAVDSPGMYSICKRNLDVAVINSDGEQSYALPKRLSWQLVNEVRVASNHTGKVNVALQRPSQSMGRLRGLAEGTGQKDGGGPGDDDRSEYDEEEEEDEEYDEKEFDEDEEESESETGSETEGDSNLIYSSTDATEPECDTVTDVLVIVREEGNPVWVPCHGRQKTRRQMGGTLHPREPVFVWAQDAESLSIMNTVSGKTTTSSLPKLSERDGPLLPEAQIAEKEQMPDLGTRFGSRLLTEIRFSSDGSLLYALSINFDAASSHVTKATVSLTRFRFEAGEDTGTEEPRLEQSGDVLTTAYHFHKRVDDLPVPLGVTYWCSDAVYICLPLLTCSVKFIRMSLNPSTSDNSQPQPKIQTLNHTILIPSLTSQRRPRLLYQSSTSKTKTDDSLCLVLNPEPKLATPTQAEDRHYRQDTGCSDQCDHEDITTCHHKQEEFGRGGASVIRWSIPREGGWRDWDPEKDSMSDELQRNPSLCTFNELRGTFIDADKMFSVPIRGALNFTWKGYLSCG